MLSSFEREVCTVLDVFSEMNEFLDEAQITTGGNVISGGGGEEKIEEGGCKRLGKAGETWISLEVPV